MRKLLKFLIFPILFITVYYCNGPIEDNESNSKESKSPKQNLKKCDGKQAYFTYSINGESHEVAPVEMREANVYSDIAEASRMSSYDILWEDNNTAGNFLLFTSGENFKVGTTPFPIDVDKQAVSFKLENAGQGVAYKSTSGTLQIEGFNYILKGRASKELRDFIKGRYSGKFKNALDFLGDDNIYQIDIDFCLCGKVGI